MDLATLRALLPDSLVGEVSKLARKALQSIAKELHIRANTTNVKLKADILAKLRAETSDGKVAERDGAVGAPRPVVEICVEKKTGKKRKAAGELVATAAPAEVVSPGVNVESGKGGDESRVKVEASPNAVTPAGPGPKLEFPVLSGEDGSPTMPFARSPVGEKQSFTTDVGFASGSGRADVQAAPETVKLKSETAPCGQSEIISESEWPKTETVKEHNAKKKRCTPPETEPSAALENSSGLPNVRPARASLSDQGGIFPPTEEGNLKPNRLTLSDGQAVEMTHLVKRRSLVKDLVFEPSNLGAKRLEMAYKRVYNHGVKVGEWKGKMAAKMEGLEAFWQRYKAKSQRREAKSEGLDRNLKVFCGSDSQMANIKNATRTNGVLDRQPSEKRKAQDGDDGGKRKEPRLAQKSTMPAGRSGPSFRASMSPSAVRKSGGSSKLEGSLERRKPRASTASPIGRQGGRVTVFNTSPSSRPDNNLTIGAKPWA